MREQPAHPHNFADYSEIFRRNFPLRARLTVLYLGSSER
jgi:hypothetical protein